MVQEDLLVGHDSFADCELSEDDEAAEHADGNGAKGLFLARHKGMSQFGTLCLQFTHLATTCAISLTHGPGFSLVRRQASPRRDS